MNPFGQFGAQMQQLWARMSPGWRTLVALAVVGSAVGVVGIGWYSQQTDFQPVFTGLALEDVGAVTSKLTAQGIPYRLAGAGTTVLVPSDQVQQVRVAMAVEGLPAKGAGKGWEGLDQSPFGTTPFTQHLLYLRAQQTEIGRTIAQIDPVVQARVHITRPEPSPFIRSEKPTTASVMLKLRAGASLSRSVGSGIAAFVAKSVEGLAKENVTLMDTNGRVLFQEVSGDEGIMSSQLDYRRDLEGYLAGKAENMLAAVLGPGKANIRVNADVNTKSIRERKESIPPDGKVVQSESLTTTKSTGSEGTKAASTGTSANLGKGTSTGGSKESNAVTENSDTKYLYSKITQDIDDKMGAITRLTIAAFVELPTPEGNKSKEVLAKEVSEIIKNAVGFKADRDDFKMTEIKFAEPKLPVLEPETPPTPVWINWLDVVRNISIALAALVTCVLGLTLVRRGPKATPALAAATVDEPADILRFQRLTQALERNPEALTKVLDNWLQAPGGSPPAAAA